MKKIVILPLLILSVSSMFGMENIPMPTFPERGTHQPNQTQQDLMFNLQALQEASSFVVNTTDYQVFEGYCDLLKDNASTAGYPKIARAAKVLKKQAYTKTFQQPIMEPKQLFN